MARTPPGKTREKVYAWMVRRLEDGNPPSVRELQAAMGFSAVQSAQQHLEALVSEGRLLKAPGSARGYRLPAKARRALRRPGIPLLGEVRAGALTTALENPEGFLPASADRPSGDLFALTVRGDSMIDAGIRPGDIAIVRRQNVASTGDIVVAALDDEATVKRLVVKSRRLELHPANPDYPIITLAQESARILGKVVEIRRYLENIPLLENEDETGEPA